MLTQILRGTDWVKLGDYLSPAFFDTVSPLALAKQVGNLSRSYVTRRGFADACVGTQAILTDAKMPVCIRGASTDAPLCTSAGLPPEKIGELLLEIYFRQIFHASTALLDFRSTSFSVQDATGNAVLSWAPSPLFVHWDPEFIANVRSMYIGFYAGDWRRFDEALANLGLTAGRDLLVKHFGANQEAVTFRLQDFRATFNEIFFCIQKAKGRLPAEFIAFGAGLVCLYEHLEALGVSINVGKVFARSMAGQEARW